MKFMDLVDKIAVLFVLAVLAPTAAFAQASGPSAAPQIAAAAPAIQAYVLGPEDVVEVQVLGRSDFDTRARIEPDGTIQLPYLGSVAASNRTSAELREEVQRALEKGGFFAKPIVSVSIVSFASRYVTVLGSVVTPGLVPVDRPYRLSEIIARVGGVKDDAADYVVLRSGDKPERRYLINDLATGGANEDPAVTPGDKVFVPRADLFYISGQVKTPGAYPLLTGTTLRMALSRGGGLTDAGSDHSIKITRDGKKLDHVDLDEKIQAADVIVVGERLF